MTKVIIITGGTKGIGRALVDTYLEKGYFVATFSSNEKNTSFLKTAYHGHSRLLVDTFDIRNEEACIDFVRKLIKKQGRIDTLIFNSGICSDKTFSKMTFQQWQDVLTINLLALFPITQAVFNQMKQQPTKNHIFFMTSQAGINGSFGQANYAASKAALIGLSNTLALEGEPYQIKVNAISPAALTDMTLPVIKQIEIACLEKNIDFPKEWEIGSPEEVAHTIYNLSETPSLKSGQVFAINGDNTSIYTSPQKKTIR